MKSYKIKGVEWRFTPSDGRVRVEVVWNGLKAMDDILTLVEYLDMVKDLRSLMK